MMNRVYYAVRYHLDNKDRYLIWYSTETDNGDGVVVNQAGMIPVFRTRQSLLAYAQAEGLSPLEEDDPAFVNLDVVGKWLMRKRPAQLICVAFLDTWNLFADMSASVGGNFDPDKDNTQKIYLKLFWGNNLPAITPVGKYYESLWSGSENRIMRQVLRDGLLLFRGHVVLLNITGIKG